MLGMIVACDRNGAIGKDGDLPWRQSTDLQHFKKITMGTKLIMGRKTWESIGRPLPGRTSIVVTRDADYVAEGAKVVHSMQDASRLAESIAVIDGTEEAFVIGGAALYATAMPIADRFHLTRVHAGVEGDTVLSGFDESEWREVSRDDFQSNEANPFDYSICILEKHN